MNFKTSRSSVTTAVLFLFAMTAGAAEPGFYVTASSGLGEEDPKSAGINVGNSLGVFHIDPDSVEVDSDKLAWSVGLGYRINRYLAGELEYVDFGTTDVTENYSTNTPGAPIPFPTVIVSRYSSNVTGPALSVLGTLPVGANFELFLRGGALFASREFEFGLGSLDEKFSRTVWLAGAGVTWSFAKRWAVRAEFQKTGKLGESIVSGETQLQRMSLGVLFAL
jgi:opacity protein-like surface antigen